MLLGVPERSVLILFGLGLAGVIAALAGAFRPVVVLPIAALLIAVSWRAVPPLPSAGRRPAAAVAVLLGLVAVWLWAGSRAVAEYVVVNRDPGFLTLRALWMSGHPSALIPVGAAEGAAVSGAAAGTEAFALSGGLLHAQGNTMLPSVLAVGGWWGGDRMVLGGNLVIGAVALLGCYALARRLIGPWWALLPVVALGVSLPFLAFARAAYTEPLTLALLTGGLAIAVGGWRQGPIPGVRGIAAHLLAGAMVGGVAAARIDGGVSVSGFVLGVTGAAWLDGAFDPGARRRAFAGIAGAVVVGAIGVLDAAVLSPAYLATHRTQLGLLGVATMLVVVLCAALLKVPRDAAHRLLRHRRALAVVLPGAVLAVGVLLATRPWWYTAHRIDPSSGAALAVQGLQMAAEVPVDGTRSYDEQTLTWVAWYLGVPAVVLGVLGWALLTRWAVRRRDAGAAVGVVTLMVAAVFPLVMVNITPDQLWAVRRLVPGTFPAVLIGAATALAALAGPVRTPWRGRVGRWAAEPRPRRVLAGLGVASMVALPLSVWSPAANTVELSGRLTQAEAVCAALDDLGAERVIWVHSSPFRYLATLRVICDVEVVEFVQPPTAEQLAAVREAWGGGTVAAASFDAEDLPWLQQPSVAVGRTESTTLGRELIRPPYRVDTTVSEVWLGTVQPDGRVTPLG
ncbi:hypothetical protein [Cellulomonas denverensis]|uniref:Glycosyltransferase RgtA/B/C/D-like domain-containing protein n=1 Tax=Cellulomonas denverensis TaxID=264297 RepID=A0A7X6KV43_9CELL|nr:hypothetical protein [Cellulomonas denverensis]NKY22534.1 hypothetical protein [Cellulomonas denverensis]GIG24822.1 hypothetical protein Cde04nite_10660 [Cellulomonas denverensis]